MKIRGKNKKKQTKHRESGTKESTDTLATNQNKRVPLRLFLWPVLIIFVLLPILSYTLLRTPFVQTLITQKIANHFSERLGCHISVSEVDINAALDIILKKVLLQDQNNDTILYVPRITADIDKIEYRMKRIRLGSFVFKDGLFRLQKRQGVTTLNIQFLLDSLAHWNQQKGTTWAVQCTSLGLVNAQVIYWDHNTPVLTDKLDLQHFHLKNVGLSVEHLKMDSGEVAFRLAHLKMEGPRGLAIRKCKSDVIIGSDNLTINNLLLNTDFSEQIMDIQFQFAAWDDWKWFSKKVRFEADIYSSVVDLTRLSENFGFEPALAGHTELSGQINGRVNNLKGRDVELNIGHNTRFAGNINLTGLPEITETFIHLDVTQSNIDKRDVSAMLAPDFRKLNSKISYLLKHTGNIRVKGLFTGFINDFVSYAKFQTDLGGISSDISLKQAPDNQDVIIEGNVKTANFNLGRFLGADEQIEKLNLHASIKGNGFAQGRSIKLILAGAIDSVMIKGYHYKNAAIEGEFVNKSFTGRLRMEDRNLKFDFLGHVDISGQMPAFDFETTIREAHLSRLNLTERDPSSLLSGTFTLDFTGNNLDNLIGAVRIENTLYQELGKSLKVDHAVLNIIETSRSEKRLQIESDLLNAELNGQFSINGLPVSLKHIMDHYLAFGKEQQPTQPPAYTQDFSFNLVLKDLNPLLSIFQPQLVIAPNAVLNGAFSSQLNRLNLMAQANHISWHGRTFNHVTVIGKTTDNNFKSVVKSDKLIISDSLEAENLSLTTSIIRDSITFDMTWNNFQEQKMNGGTVKGYLTFLQDSSWVAGITDGRLLSKYGWWQVEPGNTIVSDSTSLTLNAFKVMCNNQYIMVDGHISKDSLKPLLVEFKEFNISDLDHLLPKRNVDIDGRLSGKVELYNLLSNFTFLSDLKINGLRLNEVELGDAQITSRWNRELKALNIETSIYYRGTTGINKSLQAIGYFYPGTKKNNFDLDVTVSNFKINTLERYFTRFSSDFKGLASGQVKITGPTRKPELKGSLKVIGKTFYFDYLNTSYSFVHDLKIEKDRFTFSDLKLNDIRGQEALCNGIIRHTNFRDWQYDITLQAKNFLCLKTSPEKNNLFYGTAYGSGVVKISGSQEHISLDIAARTEPGTQLFIPISDEEEITEQHFISFITHSKKDDKEVTPIQADLSGIEMNFDLDITQDAEVQMIFDEKIGDVLKGYGSGNINMEINAQGDFNMYGDYIIQQGNYLFTLQNVINKRFEIESGGKISWNGDPYDALIDLQAVYRLKSPLYDLLYHQVLDMGHDTTYADVYKKRYLVECILHLEKQLFNPDITFDIRLPNIDENTRTLVSKFINTENEQEMNRQMLALLVLNRFIQPQGEGQSNIGYERAGTTTSSEMLFNQLSNWLSKINDDFDVGINYRPGDEINSQELEVALSTQLFNDRILIDGNFGAPIEGNKTNHSTSNIVGDVNIEYKITPEGKFRVKAFNKSNQDDLLRQESPYTQGIGVFYRRDFDRLGELLRKKK